MAELVLRNKNILKKLDWIKSEVLKSKLFEDQDLFNSYMVYHDSGKEAKTNPESFLSEDWLLKKMNDPTHKGHPKEYASFPVSEMEKRDERVRHVNHYARNEFIRELGAEDNAVFLWYPPGGFVGWHTNQNNSGYQFIFSWSEKGDGYFQYYDKKQNKIIKLPDKPGWQVRHFHFGETKEEHCWHSAYTKVKRITVCALFRYWDKTHLKDQVKQLRDELIDEIESE